MIDKLTQFETKIAQLQQKRAQLQTRQAVAFYKEVQRIFKQEFSSELALSVLKDAWKGASQTQKEKWHQSAKPFLTSSKNSHNETPSSPPKIDQNEKE